MKRKARYEFHPYSPRRRHLRDWEGWIFVAWAILIIVLATTVVMCNG